MKDRQPRTFGRKDGLVSRKLSGPVIRLDPTTMQPYDSTNPPKPARLNITDKDGIKKKARNTKQKNKLGALSWKEQAEEIRRVNSLRLGRVISKIDAGIDDEKDRAEFDRCSDTAKKWTVEERNTLETDPTKLTDEQLKKVLQG